MNRMNEKKIENQTAKARLFEAGIFLFAEKGYARTSVREIVERAGVAKPALYYYFNNKEGLFRNILDWATHLQEASLTEILGKRGAVLDRLLFLYHLFYQRVMENQSLYRMIYNLIFGPPKGAPPYDFGQYHWRTVAAIKTIYLEGVEKGQVRETNPDEVAVLVLSLIDYCIQIDQVFPESKDPDRPRRLLHLVFEGLALKENG